MKFTSADKRISRSGTTPIFSIGPTSRTSPMPTFSRRTNSSILAQNETPLSPCRCLQKKRTHLIDISHQSDSRLVTIVSPLRRHDLPAPHFSSPRKAAASFKTSMILHSSISPVPLFVPSSMPFRGPLSPGRRLLRYGLPGRSFSSRMGNPFTSGTLRDMSGTSWTRSSIPREKRKDWKNEKSCSHDPLATLSRHLRSFGVGCGGSPTCLRGSGLRIVVV